MDRGSVLPVSGTQSLAAPVSLWRAPWIAQGNSLHGGVCTDLLKDSFDMRTQLGMDWLSRGPATGVQGQLLQVRRSRRRGLQQGSEEN